MFEENTEYKIKDSYLIFKKCPSIEIDGEGLPYGLKGIILPVLDNPAVINRLYKGINKTFEWNSPNIYYLGNYNQSLELEKHFGIKELSSKDNHVQVYPYGGNTTDNLEHILKNKKTFEYVKRWIFDADGIPYFLAGKEIMNSVLLPKAIPVTDVRVICGPATIVYYPTVFDGREYMQVCLYHNTNLEEYRRLCDYKGIGEFYYIKHTESLFEDVLMGINSQTGEETRLWKVGYSSVVYDDSEKRILIEDTNQRTAPYQSFLSLRAAYQRNIEMINYVKLKNNQ